MKLLILDIETCPHDAFVWGMWKQNIGTNMLKKGGYVLSWAAKWYGSKEVMCVAKNEGHATMINKIHKLLTEADAVVHFNGKKFDIPWLNQEFLLKGLTPPAPYAQVDLLTVARSKFRFPSNKLEYLLKVLKIGEKGGSGGWATWEGCMNNDPVAFKTLKKYNIEDVLQTERLYDKLKPWIKSHPNNSIFRGQVCCPTCGGTSLQRRGFAVTQSAQYIRLQCQECGSWSRTGGSQATTPEFKAISIGV